jgi:hypothetical protein
MGLTKGNITFSIYRVADNLPDRFSDFIDEKIKLYAFRSPLSDEEKTMGWTSLENVLDTNFEYANYSLGDYIVFSQRVDRKVIPPALLRLKVLEAEKEYMSDKGRDKIYRQDKMDIKENVRLELIRKTSPVPSFYEVCWSPSKGWLIFGSLSEKVKEDFEEFFKQTFGLKLIPFVPWDPQYMDSSLLENIVSSGMNTTKRELAALGREFLTWLWFKSEERNGSLMIPNEGDIELIFLQRLVLESGEGEYSETVVCRGLHADLEEGKAALRKEKKIKEARLKLGIGIDQMEFTFKTDLFQFQSLKVPSPTDSEEEERDKEGRLLERIYFTETATVTMEKLFSFFLEKRLSPEWITGEMHGMKKWLSE